MSSNTYYLNTETIEAAYRELCKLDIDNASLIHIFYILKGCGYNNISYEPINLIADRGFEKAARISLLFAPQEKLPEKNDFINPFDMKSWHGGQPTEPLRKWISSRVKNNVVGGATTWRELINYDAPQDQIKFSYNYIEILKRLTLKEQKINLVALAVWANRFTVFPRTVSWRELVQEFVGEYKLNDEEVSALMHTSINGLSIDFSARMHDTAKIRGLIGNPEGMSSWTVSEEKEDENILSINVKMFTMDDFLQTPLTEEKILESLNDYYQVIISGPPATSKSYLADSVSKKFNKVVKLQFHPQYSYQDFVGGFVVNKDKVEYRPGILLELLHFAEQNPDKKCLLIIDEINRANVSQVFGEVVQCLDRDYSTVVRIDKEAKQISLPKNLYILGTMNTSDRTLGSLDHAVRRRFLFMYCPPDPDVLLELCTMEDGVSLRDFLKKLNEKLYSSLKNRELVLGQAIFLNENVKGGEKYKWNFNKLETLFNYKILPMVEEFCYGDEAKVVDILGEKLPRRLHGDEFKKEFKEFLAL